MKHIILIFTLLTTSLTFSQNKNAKATLEVDGVCNMCKARIEKAAIKSKGVKSAKWSIETKQLNLIYNDEKTNINRISKSIAEAGHDNKLLKATEEAYNKVHPCCKYRDEKVLDDHKK